MLRRPRVYGAPVGVFLPDCDDGHPCGSTVPVPAQLERFGRVGQWRVAGRRLVLGCCRVTLCGLHSPSVWLTFGYVQTCSQGLVPGPARLSDLVASGCGGYRAEVCIELQVAYAVRVAMPCPAGCLGGCPDQAPGTQVPKPLRCTTRATNRTPRFHTGRLYNAPIFRRGK